MKQENQSNDRTPMSVLLAEDSAPVRQRLRKLMTEVPMLHVAAEACTATEAKQLFETVRPDAVLLDLAFPDGSGTDVLQHIRGGGGSHSVVIILSNHLEPETYNRCSELGADFLFSKSDEFEQAIETLRALAERKIFSPKHWTNAQICQTRLAVTSPVGIHARPAAMLVKQAQAFDADIEISLHGSKASAKSILGVLTLCAGYGAKVTVTATGTDAEEAIRTITRLFASGFEEPHVPGIRAQTPIGQDKPETILVVDDNESIRILIKTILELRGYRVFEACNGVEAIALFAASAGDITAVILDMIMPMMDGHETMSALRRMAPTLPVLTVSGFMDKPPFENDSATIFLRKPFGSTDLTLALRALLDKAAASQSADH